MKMVDVDPTGDIFTAVNPDGTTTVYAVSALNAWIDANSETCEPYKFGIPVEEYHIAGWIADKSIEVDRCDALMREENSTHLIRPIVFVERPDGDGVVLLDGRHRYAVWFALKAPMIPGFVLPWEIGRQFIVEDFPQVPTEVVFGNSRLVEIRALLNGNEK